MGDLNEYVIMPNHFHTIFTIRPEFTTRSVGVPLVGARSVMGSQSNGQGQASMSERATTRDCPLWKKA